MTVRPTERRTVAQRCVALGLGAALAAGLTAAPAQALPSTAPVQGQIASVVAAAATEQEVQAYVSMVYQDLFGRDPDPVGLSTWTTKLTTGTPRVAVANAITSSREFRTGLVRDAYEYFLLRQPDPAGLETWLGALGRGATIAQIQAGFIASPEYYGKAGGTDADWVVALYDHVLGRGAAPSEVASWVDQLEQGASRRTVAMGFLLSTEHLSTLVNSYYEVLLLRGLDPSGLRTWVSKLQAGERDEVIIGGIIASAEYWGFVAG